MIIWKSQITIWSQDMLGFITDSKTQIIPFDDKSLHKKNHFLCLFLIQRKEDTL